MRTTMLMLGTAVYLTSSIHVRGSFRFILRKVAPPDMKQAVNRRGFVVSRLDAKHDTRHHIYLVHGITLIIPPGTIIHVCAAVRAICLRSHHYSPLLNKPQTLCRVVVCRACVPTSMSHNRATMSS